MIDYFKALIGICFSLVPYLFFKISNELTFIFIFIFIIFVYYGFETFLRNISEIIVTDNGIYQKNAILKEKYLSWDKIDTIKLRYFSTRRDKEKGWLELSIYKNNRKIKIYSSITNFSIILNIIANKAKNNNFEINNNTRLNFRAFGLII